MDIMFGIILWMDGSTESGIIWCEDQLQLAYFGKEEVAQTAQLPGTGDFVHFEVIQQNGVRLARNVIHLDESANRDALPNALKSTRRPLLKVAG